MPPLLHTRILGYLLIVNGFRLSINRRHKLKRPPFLIPLLLCDQAISRDKKLMLLSGCGNVQLCNSPYLETAFFLALGGFLLLSWKPPLHPPHPLLPPLQRQWITLATVHAENNASEPPRNAHVMLSIAVYRHRPRPYS